MHRHRCGEYEDRRFWPVACRHKQGAALNDPSQPRGRALMHDVPSASSHTPGTPWEPQRSDVLLRHAVVATDNRL
jgi:hypothetical protein